MPDRRLPDRTNVAVVIPALNESLRLRGVVTDALAECANVIVIDDGSDDGTAECIADLPVTLIRHATRMGKGASLRDGFREALARGCVGVLTMDGDGQHDPKDIELLVTKIIKGYDLVVGARQSGSQASLGRGIANSIYNKLASYMTNHKVEDLTSGFRAARTDKIKEFVHLLPNGFSYPTTSTMAFFRAGYSVAYVPIHAAERIGKSHIKLFKDGVRFLLIIFKIGTLYSPLKMFLPVSVSVFLIGMSYYAYTFFTVGRFTNMSALMFTTALIIFMVGLVSEQITQLTYTKK